MYDENDLFLSLAQAHNFPRKQRLKGYYVCPLPCGEEFIKAVFQKKARCPFCGRLAERLLVVDYAQQCAVFDRWKACGQFSLLRADMDEEKENVG